MHSFNKDFDDIPPQSSIKTKKTMYFTEIRRNNLSKDLKYRRADQSMLEEETKEWLKNRFFDIFDQLSKNDKKSESLKLKTEDLREVLETVSDTYTFSQVIEKNGFLDQLFDHLRNIYNNKLHTDAEYEDTIDVCLWFFCNASKYGAGLALFTDQDNFDMLFNIAIEVVSARCLSTYANFLGNYIMILVDQRLFDSLDDLREIYYPKISTRLEEAMSQIIVIKPDTSFLIDSAIFVYTLFNSYLDVKIDVIEAS